MVIKITFKIKIMNNNLKIEFMEIITNNSHNNTKKNILGKIKKQYLLRPNYEEYYCF